MATFNVNGETSEEKKKRLKLRIVKLMTTARQYILNLEDINNEIKNCEKELGGVGDFP